jgi:hypothetical protein
LYPFLNSYMYSRLYSFTTRILAVWCMLTLAFPAPLAYGFAAGNPEAGPDANNGSSGTAGGGSGPAAGSGSSGFEGSAEVGPGADNGSTGTPGGGSGPAGGYGGESGGTGFEGSPEANPGAFGSGYGNGNGGTGFEGSPEANPGSFGVGEYGNNGNNPGNPNAAGYFGGPTGNPFAGSIDNANAAPPDTVAVTTALDSVFGALANAAKGVESHSVQSISITENNNPLSQQSQPQQQGLPALDPLGTFSNTNREVNTNPSNLGGLNYSTGAPTKGSNPGLTSTSVTVNGTLNLGTVPAPVGPANTFTPTELGNYKSYTTTQVTPAIEMAMGRLSIGVATPGMQASARAAGFNLDDPKTVAALAFAHEIPASYRNAIVAAYNLDPSLKTLDPEVAKAAAQQLNAFTNQAALNNRTLAEQLGVRSYVSSITIDKQAFTVMSDPTTRAALSTLAGQLTDGTIAKEQGLSVAAPASTANHTHAADPSAFASGTFPSWSSAMSGLVSIAGTISGSIRSEGDPTAKSAATIAGAHPDLTAPQSVFSIDVSGRMSPATQGNFNAATAGTFSAKEAGSFSFPETTADGTPTGNTVTVSRDGTGTVTNQSGATVASLSKEEASAAYGLVGSKDYTPAGGFKGVDPDTFADTFAANNPLSASPVGGIPTSSGLPAVSYTPTIAISPSLRDAFEEAGIKNPESVMGRIDFAASVPTVGSQNISNQPAVVDFTDRVSVVVSGPSFGISEATGLPSNVSVKSGADVADLSPAAKSMITEIANKLDFPITVTSGHRSETENAKTGGAKASQHLSGNAVDIRTSDLTAAQKEALSHAIASTATVTGWGIYSGSVHVDSREGSKASWGYDYSHGTLSAGLKSQPEMAAAYQEWAAGTHATGPAPAAGTVVSVSQRDLAQLEAVNKAYEAANPPAVDTSIETNSHGYTTGSRSGLGGFVDKVGGIISDVLGRFGIDIRGGSVQPLVPENGGDATSTRHTSLQTNDSAQTASIMDAVRNITGWLFGTPNQQTDVYADLSLQNQNPASRPYIPVTVTIDETNHTVVLTRNQIQNASSLVTEDGYGEDGDASNALGIAILFDENGNVWYSDGTYAPRYENGEKIDTGIDYVYAIERYEDGKLVGSSENAQTLPGNFFTEAWHLFFSDRSSFTLSDVTAVTYVYVDPDTSVADDEYYEYTITLVDGSTRTVAVPVLTTLAYYSERFASIGYAGDAFALAQMGTETGRTESAHTPGIIERITSGITSLVSKVTGIGTPTDTNEYTDLASVNAGQEFSDGSAPLFTDADVRSTLIYLDAPITCPNVDGFTKAYVYEVVVDIPNNDTDGVIHSGMCGIGTADVYASEVAKDLVRQGFFASLSGDTILRNLTFRFFDNSSTSTMETVVPNTTNTIALEAKVVSASGATVRDWSSAPVTLSRSQQLELRWNAPDYAQCLPFIGDNGAYSITRGDRTLTTGNTEAEGYDLTEQRGTYRIECNGQKNGESGVDEKTIPVTIQ